MEAFQSQSETLQPSDFVGGFQERSGESKYATPDPRSVEQLADSICTVGFRSPLPAPPSG